ncbi:MAG TPA: hypothetical protein ENK85_01775 [Saprospiraceae bacterium]|nr:hypothetical protein [Saprospiraceae bacterium]
MMFKKLIFIALAMLLFWSCQEHYLYADKHEFGEAGWTYADSLKFDFNISDTTKRYNLILTVHHRPDFANENLYVKFATIFPKGQQALGGRNRVEQVTSLTLAQKDGRWLGKCSDKECVLKIPIQTNTWFPDPGPYSLLVEQYMRRDSVKILGIDFAIQEKKK